MPGPPISLPGYPQIPGRISTEQDTVVIEDDFLGQRVRVEAQGDLDRLVAVLRACDGCTPVEQLVGMNDAATQDVLGTLQTLKMLHDGRAAPERVLAQAIRSGPVSQEEILAAVRVPRWRDPRAPVLVGDRASRVLAGRRPHSIPLDQSLLDADAPPVRSEEVAPMLSAAYGSTGTSKPVPSAGRMWPVSLHLWSTEDGLADASTLFWFDDEEQQLHDLGVHERHFDVASWFVQRDYIEALLAHGAAFVLLSVDLCRVGRKYGNRAVIYASIEVGSIIELIALDASEAGFEVRPIGGFSHLTVKERTGIDLEPLLLVAVIRTSAN